MELPPETQPIPTLLTIEQSWIGPPPTVPPFRPIDIPSKFTYRTIVSQRVIAKLERYILSPHALCDTKSQIICFIGVDKLGTDKRYFSVLSIHELSSPSTSCIEMYTGNYINILQKRARYEHEYTKLLRTRDYDDSDEDGMIPKTKLMYYDEKRDVWLINEVITYMNRYFCMIGDTNHSVIMKRIRCNDLEHEYHDPNSNRNVEEPYHVQLKTLMSQSFASTYGNVSITIKDSKKKDKKIAITTLWLRHSTRKTYDSVGFSTTADTHILNLWHGLRPIPTNTNDNDAEPFFQHILEVFCKNDMVLFEYITRLFAHYVQKPLTRTDICLVLRGSQGTGKGYVFDVIFKRIFGEYYASAQLEHLERFDGCLAKALMVFFDETADAWDKKLAAKLKKLITSPNLMLEEKYKSGIKVKNHLNVILCTNYDYTAPVEYDDCRYFVLDVADHRCVRNDGNRKYWDKLLMVPPSSVHNVLLQMDITNFSPRDIPMIDGKR